MTPTHLMKIKISVSADDVDSSDDRRRDCSSVAVVRTVYIYFRQNADIVL